MFIIPNLSWIFSSRSRDCEGEGRQTWNWEADFSSYLCLELFLWDGGDTPRSVTDFVDCYKFSMCKLIRFLMIAFSISTCVFRHKDYYLRKYCCTKNDFNFLSNEHIMDIFVSVIFHETILILKFLASLFVFSIVITAQNWDKFQ